MTPKYAQAVLDEALVRAVETRVRAAGGMLSVRRALLMDARGVTDTDVAEWMARGEFVRAQGMSSSTRRLSLHDKLCSKLVELDTVKGSHAQLLAGERMLEILASKDPRARAAQVKLILHLQEALGDEGAAATAKTPGISQADMDLLTAEELAETEADMRLRAEATARIDARLKAAKLRSIATAARESGGETVH